MWRDVFNFPENELKYCDGLHSFNVTRTKTEMHKSQEVTRYTRFLQIFKNVKDKNR